MGVSLKDVALRAGVSVKTVSNVVNNYPHISPGTREKVQRAIDALGYRPNLSARHLRKGRTGIVALAIPELGNPYFAELAAAVIDAVSQHGRTVLLDPTAGLREREVQAARGFQGRLIDGLILSPIQLENEDLLARPGGPPMVLLGEREYDAPFDHIAIDNVAAARAAVAHLLGLGRRRIAFIGARQESSRQPAHLRLRGWREELAQAGLVADPALVVETAGYDRRDGARAMAALLDGGVRPDAVFAYNDLIALGALRTLYERGVRVPEEVAVVGFDDIEESRYGAVSLTTVAPDKEEIARTAVDCLIARIDAGDGDDGDGEGDGGDQGGPGVRVQDTARIMPGHRLVVRESTAGPAADRAARAAAAR